MQKTNIFTTQIKGRFVDLLVDWSVSKPSVNCNMLAETTKAIWKWGGKPWQAQTGVWGQSPPEAETLFAFRRSIEAANLPTFLKSRNTENQTFVLSRQCGYHTTPFYFYKCTKR